MAIATIRGPGGAVLAAVVMLFAGAAICPAQALVDFPQCKDSSISMTSRTSTHINSFGPYNRLQMVGEKKVDAGLLVESAPQIGSFRFKIPHVQAKQVFREVGQRRPRPRGWRPATP